MEWPGRPVQAAPGREVGKFLEMEKLLSDPEMVLKMEVEGEDEAMLRQFSAAGRVAARPAGGGLARLRGAAGAALWPGAGGARPAAPRPDRVPFQGCAAPHRRQPGQLKVEEYGEEEY